MLTSIAIIFILGLFGGAIFKKLHLPPLIGMMIVGILISPNMFDLLDDSLLLIAKDIRQIALVIILTRAGLSLNIQDLKKVGKEAMLLCFLPACFEMIAITFIAPLFLDVTYLEAAIVGSVVAAVSPAVVVPRMIRCIEEGFGTSKSIPQMMLAGVSVDDVFVIVVFSALTAMDTLDTFHFASLLQVPVSILLGILMGSVIALLLYAFFKAFKVENLVQVFILLSVSFLFLQIQTSLEKYIPVSGLLAIMSMGIVLRQKDVEMAMMLSKAYNALWKGAEIFLFVLVGVAVDLTYVQVCGGSAIIVILLALVFRMIGVYLCFIKSSLNTKERLFCMVSYTPKATVQAAIGAIPLTLGFACGNIVLSVAVLAILITAPFGAICMDYLYKKCLQKG